jgi:hypothetical protein
VILGIKNLLIFQKITLLPAKAKVVLWRLFSVMMFIPCPLGCGSGNLLQMQFVNTGVEGFAGYLEIMGLDYVL